jgi:hypothetical protein
MVSRTEPATSITQTNSVTHFLLPLWPIKMTRPRLSVGSCRWDDKRPVKNAGLHSRCNLESHASVSLILRIPVPGATTKHRQYGDSLSLSLTPPPPPSSRATRYTCHPSRLNMNPAVLISQCSTKHNSVSSITTVGHKPRGSDISSPRLEVT